MTRLNPKAALSLSLAAALSLGAVCSADHIVQPLEERIAAADLIFVAEVTKVVEVKEAHDQTCSLATLNIGEVLKRREGLPGSPKLRFNTGYACDGQLFAPKDKAIFLVTRGEDGILSRVNWEGGALKIKDGKVSLDGAPVALEEALAKLRGIVKAQRAASSPRCPRCEKSDEVVKVYYGRGSASEASEKGGKSGGCAIGPDSPTHHCERCDAGFQSKN